MIASTRSGVRLNVVHYNHTGAIKYNFIVVVLSKKIRKDLDKTRLAKGTQRTDTRLSSYNKPTEFIKHSHLQKLKIFNNAIAT